MSTQRGSDSVDEAPDDSAEQDTALLVHAVVANRPELFASEVQQLCFCGDLYAAEVYDRRLSRVTYEANMYGPYSDEIETALDALVDSGDVLTRPALRDGRRNQTYVLADGAENASADLSNARTEIVRHVCEVAPSDTEGLEKVVVNSRPYRRASGGDQITFDQSARGLPPELSTDLHPDLDEDELLPSR